MVHFTLMCTNSFGTRNSLYTNNLEHLDYPGTVFSYRYFAPNKEPPPQKGASSFTTE